LESPVGLAARVGYRFHPYLAGEVEFRWFANASAELDNGDDTLDAVKIETLALTGNVKGYILTGRIQPFLLAGAGFMHLNGTNKFNLDVETSGDEFAARFGGGVDLYINRNFVVVVEGGYVLPTGKLSRLDHVLWSVGLQYRF
jgi:opacity protein-like surface antigen